MNTFLNKLNTMKSDIKLRNYNYLIYCFVFLILRDFILQFFLWKFATTMEKRGVGKKSEQPSKQLYALSFFF